MLLTMIATLSAILVQGQTLTDSTQTIFTKKDSLTTGYLLRITQHTAQCYKLYPTENMWTFLELETYSGRIWQVQYSTKGSNYRFKTALNNESLVPYSEDTYAGRFELYKTQNIYNFILLDTKTGSTWQVQWSAEAQDRFVLRIW